MPYKDVEYIYPYNQNLDPPPKKKKKRKKEKKWQLLVTIDII